MKYVYVAGPYTNGDVAANVALAMELADDLLDRGHAPYVPHLSHYLHLYQLRPYEDWMDLDFAWLAKCDCLLRIPGESPGADREVEFAKDHDIPVFHTGVPIEVNGRRFAEIPRDFLPAPGGGD